ncbi:unnamed protein product [Tilletia controversa]|uniref:Phosphatidate phosphatase APP1 catalytic domain-containing protein n=1 Tax=Tilletia controversa TaxID=13291 RepID=A0A8X7MV42_9BASI|nr:hypothetical protein CF328_g3253 [Tilletia controversa]KAE8248431.1 hypothetical protein A4X06_0g3722 [Tilletia controversa]CAD6961457.1 unnamed protein product [Tilletia controversa]
MDDRNLSSSGTPSQSLSGYHVRSRAMDIASRAKARATSAYAVAAAAAASSSTAPSNDTAMAAERPSSSAAFARLASGARVKAANALDRAAGALSEGLDREREREWQRRSGQAANNWRSNGSQFGEADDPDTPRPSTAQLRRTSDYQDQRTPTIDQGQSQASNAPWSTAFSGRNSSEQSRLRDSDRPDLNSTLLSGRPTMSSSESSSSIGPAFTKLQNAARKRLAAVGPSKSFQGPAGSSEGSGEGRRSVELGRERIMRAFSTGLPRQPDQADPQNSALRVNNGSKGRRSHATLAPVAPGMPLHAPGSEEAVLLPGWAVRRRSKVQQQQKVAGAETTKAGADVHVLLAGVVLRTPEAPSRSQRIFLRLAKQIAALPKMSTPSSSFSLPDGSSRTRLPIVLPNFSGAPLSDEPAQIDDLSAFADNKLDPAAPSPSGGSKDSQSASLAGLAGLASPVLSAQHSSSSSSSAFSGPSSPILDADDGDFSSFHLTDRLIQKVVQGGNDDLLLRAMERIGALPVEEKPLVDSEFNLGASTGVTSKDRDEDIIQSPTVLGADSAFSAKGDRENAAFTDAIPPLDLDSSVASDKVGDSSVTTAASTDTSPSKLRKLFGSGMSSGGESPKLGPSTEASSGGSGGSGAATPIMFARNESSSRLSRFAESFKRRASYVSDGASLSSSLSSISSAAGLSPRLQPVNGPPNGASTPALSWPSGSGVWSDRTFEQLLALQQNLDSRLRAFWTFRVPDRHVWIEILPVFKGEDEKDVHFGSPTSSSADATASRASSLASSAPSVSEFDFGSNTDGTRRTMLRPLLAATKARSNTTGQFHDKFVIPWHKLDSYCRTFFSGTDGSEARRPEDIVCLKKRAVLLESDSPSGPSAKAEASPWVCTDVDEESSSIRIISDVDDTVKRSDVTGGVRRIFHSVFVKHFEEVQIPGVAEWYRNLRQQGGAGFHFVSNSPLELHGIVRGFLESAGFPRAHLHLKHYATGTRNLFTSWLEPAGERKKGAVVAILDEFPTSKFILIGDSGELDMELYTAIAAERRTQILGIFIRNVSSSLKPDAALQLGNAIMGLGALGGEGSSAVPRKPLFKRNATIAALPTLEPQALSGHVSPPDFNSKDDALRTGRIPDNVGASVELASTSSLAAHAAAGAGDGSGTNPNGTDEARRKRDVAFALRVQRARANCPPEIPLLFYTRGEKATTEIALDMIAKAKAKAQVNARG